MNKERPEHTAPPEIYYNDEEANKYTKNSRTIDIQRKMTERAIELLCLEDSTPSLVLDVGCGSGLSGDVLSEHGHEWLGIDISESMLNIAQDREVDGDTILSDMGDGFCYRVGTFDAAISISAVQWLCNVDKKIHNPVRRLQKFFFSLYKCLKKGGRAVLQFYPENSTQMELITTNAMKVGFSGGLVVDYPHSTKAKKYFLCLFAGMPNQDVKLPEALSQEVPRESVKVEPRSSNRGSRRKERVPLKSKD
eukprot:gene9653-1857_t